MSRSWFGRPLLWICLFFLLAPMATAAEKDSAGKKQKDKDEGSFFGSNGVRIHYIERGEGEPVLMIHGFTASASMNWQSSGLVDKLAENYHVIAIDNRGHGKSDKPHDPAAYGLEMVEDQVRLLDHLGIDRAHVVGYSMGGFITERLLVDHPDRIITATIGGAGWEDQENQQLTFIDDLAESLEAGEGIGPLIKHLTPEGATPPTEEQIQLMNTVVLAVNDPKALAAVIRGMRGLFIPKEKLAATTVPILAIIGEHDPLKTGVDALAEIVPAARIVVIEGADHMTAFRNPRFADSLLQFLNEHASTENAQASAEAATSGATD